MQFTPIFTEKSMNQAKNGMYSFWVLPEFTKGQVKKFLEDTLNVKIAKILTQNYKKSVVRTARGTRKTIKAMKKILVTLKSGKIEMFDVENKK
jgi:ribosomal protein L23